jgi:hypothetical protein
VHDAKSELPDGKYIERYDLVVRILVS